MAIYYISTTGDNTTGDGSQGNPWATLQKFLDSSSENDTCMIENGTYAMEGTYSITNRTIQAVNKGQVIFDGEDIVRYWDVYDEVNFIGLTFINLRGNTSSSHGIFHGSGSVPVVCNISSCVFRDNKIAYQGGFSRGPLFNTSISTTWNILACLFYNNRVTASGGTKTHYCGGGVMNLSNSTIIQNITDGTQINYFFYNQSNDNSTAIWKNNIIYNSTEVTFNISDINGASDSSDINYNCFYGSIDRSKPASSCYGPNNLIDTDPLFIEVANNNYNLSPSSPCIDAGTLI